MNPFNVWADIGDPGLQNLVRLVLHPNGIKPYVKNWAHFTGYFMHNLQQLRIETFFPADDHSEELIRRMSTH